MMRNQQKNKAERYSIVFHEWGDWNYLYSAFGFMIMPVDISLTSHLRNVKEGGRKF